MPGKYCYDYPHPAVTADIVLFSLIPPLASPSEPEAPGGTGPPALSVLLIERAREPYRGRWAVPGGFVEIDEPLDHAARRELEEETNISGVELERFAVFDAPGRDPRGRVITQAYVGIVRDPWGARAGDDAANAAWHPVRKPPRLAFDHDHILRTGLDALQDRAQRTTIAFRFLASDFTLGQLCLVYEQIFGTTVDQDHVRQRMLGLGIIEPCGTDVRGAGAGPAQRTHRRGEACLAQSAGRSQQCPCVLAADAEKRAREHGRLVVPQMRP